MWLSSSLRGQSFRPHLLLRPLQPTRLYCGSPAFSLHPLTSPFLSLTPFPHLTGHLNFPCSLSYSPPSLFDPSLSLLWPCVLQFWPSSCPYSTFSLYPQSSFPRCGLVVCHHFPSWHPCPWHIDPESIAFPPDLYILKKYIYLFARACLCVGVSMSGSGTARGSLLSPSIMWVQGIKPSWSVMAASDSHPLSHFAGPTRLLLSFHLLEALWQLISHWGHHLLSGSRILPDFHEHIFSLYKNLLSNILYKVSIL